MELWVLNRPKGDLLSAGAARSGAAAIHDTESAPSATALVVLGIGSAERCARHHAQVAIDGLATGHAPLHVVASFLDSASNWRWSESTGSLSAMLRSSSGDFGGIQASPPGAFTVRSLELAVERHALLDGRRARTGVAAAESQRGRELVPGGAPCSASDARSLEGPLAILIRSADGAFFGGMISLDPPADAGVVSLTAQYGVSLAIGPAGGVALISDCDPPPPGRVAERIYARDNWALATADSSPPGPCRTGHALLTADRAWTTTGSPLAWGAATALPATGKAPAMGADAGLQP